MAGYKRTEAPAEGFGKEAIVSDYVCKSASSYEFTAHVEDGTTNILPRCFVFGAPV